MATREKLDKKIKSIAVLVELDDGKVYQAAITNFNQDVIKNIIADDGGTVLLLSGSLDSLSINHEGDERG